MAGGRKPVELFPVGTIFSELVCTGWERKTDANGKPGFSPRMRCACGWEGLMARSRFYKKPPKTCVNCKNARAKPPVSKGPKPFPFGIGEVIKELTCLGWGKHNGYYHPIMRCSCGWEGFVNRYSIQRGNSTRCDRCAKRKAIETRWERQGYYAICPDRDHRERLLDRISAIIIRCTNPNSSAYPDYGGRGITVYAPWIANRVEFLRYLVSLDGWDVPELQLDRTDNSKGYEPGNLRFVTRSVNMSNKRRLSARGFEELKQRITALEAENADLRHRLRRAEESLHNPD